MAGSRPVGEEFTITYRVRSRHRGMMATASGLRELRWLRGGEKWPADQPGPILRQACRALDRFFGGRRLEWRFDLDLKGIAPFRRRVMEVLLQSVPPGEVITYGELAVLAGRAGAARAVGTAMSSNPVPIFVPCHRVVAAGGPGGFGSGLEHKRELLALEGYELQI